MLRNDFEEVKQRQVSVISGGGSGHEPAMGGYIGEGGLTAAVAGGVFASPSVYEILCAIRAATGPHGALVIIMNYVRRPLASDVSHWAALLTPKLCWQDPARRRLDHPPNLRAPQVRDRWLLTG